MPPTPHSLPSEDGRRELILRAALTSFAQKGFEASSTRDIAARARVNHGLIRYYFGAKEKLWQASVDLAFGEMQQDFEALEDDASIPDELERIRRMIRAYVHFVARHPEFVCLMNEEGKRRGSRMRWLVDRHVAPLYRSVETLVDRARANGAPLSSASAVHFFYILAGAAGTLFHQSEECKRISGVDPFDPAVIEEHARLLDEMLLGRGEPASSENRKS